MVTFMNRNFFRESKPYTLAEIAQRLDENDVMKVKKALHNQKYVSANADGRYSFSYVGVLIASDYIFKCFPKYVPDAINEGLYDKFKTIMRVIKKLDKEPSELFWGINENQEAYSFLQLATSLLEDYYANSLYISHHEYIEEDGDGEVLWEETANEIMPLVKNKRFIYTSYFSLDVDVDESDFVQAIQRVILTECSRQLQERDILDILDLSAVHITNGTLRDFGEPEYIVSQLEKELLIQNVTRKQNVLRLLIAYIRAVYMDHDINGLYHAASNTYYGTELFWPIWEQVCQSVFSSNLEKGVKIADLPLSNSYRASAPYMGEKDLSLLEIVEKPKWTKNRKYSAGIVVPADSFKPDLICIYRADESTDETDMSNYTFSILDAKYYAFDMEEYIASDGTRKTRFTADSTHPGLEDITKQLLYQEAYRDFISAQGYGNVRNLFLIPNDGDTFAFGKIEYDLIQTMVHPKLADIVVMKLDADKLYEEFLNDVRIRNVDRYLGLA